MGNCNQQQLKVPDVEKIPITDPASPYTYEYKVLVSLCHTKANANEVFYLNPPDYGLETFNFYIYAKQVIDGVVELLFIFKRKDGTNWLSIAKGTMKQVGSFYVFSFENQANNEIEYNPETFNPGPSELILLIAKVAGTGYMNFYLTLSSDDGNNVTDITVRADRGTSSVSIFTVESLPTITGEARLTPDGNQICQLDYSIIKIDEIEKYVKYSPSFLCYLKCGEERTIPEAVACLTKSGRIVDQTLLIGYAVTRTILSSQLFGKFSFSFLLQRYYPSFLSLLSNSEWKDFYPFFTSPEYGVVNYYSLFRK